MKRLKIFSLAFSLGLMTFPFFQAKAETLDPASLDSKINELKTLLEDYEVKKTGDSKTSL